MKAFFQQNKLVLSLYFFFLLLGSAALILFPKAEIHLTINQWHTPFFDTLFKYITYVGSWGVLVAFLILLFIKVRYALIYIVGNFFITLIVQGLKHLVFPHVLRPAAYFKGIHQLYLIPGETMHLYNSFPSGHSASAFGLFIILIYITRNHWVKVLWFLLAFLTAFSRIYLSQHFLIDVETGSLIGGLTMVTVIIFFQKHYYPDKFNHPLFYKKKHE